MNGLIKKLDGDKIKINWNKNPIKMQEFLSFLTVPVTETKDHLGWDTGWTRYNGPDNLIIGGGIVNRVEYLDRLEYKQKLGNPYNNYVNPFFLFDILNETGKKFFLDYYKEDILKALKSKTNEIEHTQKRLLFLKEELRESTDYLYQIGFRN